MKIKLLPKGVKEWRRFLFTITAIAILLLIPAFYMFNMPGKSFKGTPASKTSGAVEIRFKSHVDKLAGDIGERNTETPQALQQAVEYIEEVLLQEGCLIERQEYDVEGQTVANVIAHRPGTDPRQGIIVVGAHYDTIPGCPGANDNTSGVAALLEIAHLLRDASLACGIRFVAFVNEEPPYFQSDRMGSNVYAKSCKEKDDKIVGMIALETIGYYSDKANSQKYPSPLNMAYPSTGNFIAFVGNISSRSFLHRCIGSFRKHAQFPSEGIAAPGWVLGIGWSDHWSFWQAGYPAIMVTDTALFRYPYYHDPADTPDKLDYEKTAIVVEGLARVVRELAL
jgi:Peptidase family M28